MHTGDILRVLRRRLGCSQRELAVRCGVSSSTIARWEQGVHSPRARVVERLLDAAGLDLLLTQAPQDRGSSDEAALVRHLSLSLTQRLRLSLGLTASLRRGGPGEPVWTQLRRVARLGICVLERPHATALWIPLATGSQVTTTGGRLTTTDSRLTPTGGRLTPTGADLVTTGIRPVVSVYGGSPPPCTLEAVDARTAASAAPAGLLPVALSTFERLWVLPPALLVAEDRELGALLAADALLHARAPRDQAGRRRPAHRDPDEPAEDWRLMVTKSIRPDQRPLVEDGRAWRLGAPASLAQRLAEQ